MAKTKKDKETDEQLFVRSLLKKIGPVDPEDVIGAKNMQIEGQQKGIIVLGGKRATDNEALQLQQEAKHLKQMRIFKLLTETLRYEAQKRMFIDFSDGAPNNEVYTAGKFLMHAISTLEHIVWACENPLLLSEQKDINTSPRRVLDKRKLVANNSHT